MAPSSGRKTIAWTIARLTLHQIDVLNRDRAAVAEIDHQDGKTDRGFGGRNREHQQREDLADDVAEEGRERHDDDVLAVQEDAEDPEREQDRADRQIVSEPDRHFTHSAASASESPCPGVT